MGVICINSICWSTRSVFHHLDGKCLSYRGGSMFLSPCCLWTFLNQGLLLSSEFTTEIRTVPSARPFRSFALRPHVTEWIRGRAIRTPAFTILKSWQIWRRIMILYTEAFPI